MIDKQNMAVPAFHKFMFPLLKAVVQGKELSLKEGIKLVKEEFQLTQEDLEELLPSGQRTKVYDRVSWSFTYLKKAGLIKSVKRGIVAPTDKAKPYLTYLETQQKSVITPRDLRQFESFRDFSNVKPKPVRTENILNQEENEETPDEQFEEKFESIKQETLEDILDQARLLEPADFEKLCLSLLEKMGYGDPKHTGGPGDGGIDGKMLTDTLGLDVIFLQTKRYDEGHIISSEKINSFIGALDNNKSHKGIFITSSHFSKQCRNIVERSSKQIRLIDGKQLAKLIYRHDVGLVRKQEYIRKQFQLEEEIKKAS